MALGMPVSQLLPLPPLGVGGPLAVALVMPLCQSAGTGGNATTDAGGESQ